MRHFELIFLGYFSCSTRKGPIRTKPFDRCSAVIRTAKAATAYPATTTTTAAAATTDAATATVAAATTTTAATAAVTATAASSSAAHHN